MATRKQPKLIRRACGTMGAHMLLLERYPAFRTRQQRLEGETARRRALGLAAAEIKLAKIKVVVNVVTTTPHKTSLPPKSTARSKHSISISGRKTPTRKRHPPYGRDSSPTRKSNLSFTKSRARKPRG